MGNQTDYFNAKGYRGKFEIGDRVFGKWNNIPFIGSVGNDRLVSEVTGPEVTVQLDLPICIGEMTHRVIIVKHKDIKLLKNYD
jgi:hypothetical protein